MTLTLPVAAPKSHPEVTLPIFHLTLPFNHKAPRTAAAATPADAPRSPTSEMEVAESVALPLPTLPPSNGLPPDETSAFFSSFAPSDGTIGAMRRQEVRDRLASGSCRRSARVCRRRSAACS